MGWQTLSELNYGSSSLEIMKIVIIWTESDKYFPVLWPNTIGLLINMSVKHYHSLKQGHYKNPFCQGILPLDEITVVKPLIGDPETSTDKYWLLKLILYGLCRNPLHWYTKIASVFDKNGLQQNKYNPCLFTGHMHRTRLISLMNGSSHPWTCCWRIVLSRLLA